MNMHPLARLSLATLLACSAFAASAQQAARSPYLIQLADPPVAAYEGGVAGLAATRPAAGQRLEMTSARVQAYAAYLNTKVSAATAKVPAAKVYHRFGVVVNGFAAMLTPSELAALRKDPAVKAVTADEGMSIDTSYTTSQFLALAASGGAWSRLDGLGRAIKGEGVIIGMVDTGVWPENVSVSDKVDANGKPVPYYAAGTVVYDPLPAGRYRGTCQVGEGFTAAMCNNKLVGAQVFNNTFLQVQGANVWPGEYLSPRDEDGHGSHTLTTAGGNANSRVTVGGSDFEITGVAPRARLAAYKACQSFTESSGARRNTCYTGDTVAAIEKAVADGVDVINYSISGSNNAISGLVAQAMLGAAKANVFVAASAGNSGPTTAAPNTPSRVAHISPWVATVGNSTHDRYTEAVVTLGNGATVQGGSWQTAGLPSTPMILSRDAGVTAYADLTSDADRLALQRCYNANDRATLNFGTTASPVYATAAAAIDPAKIAGKILVCIRGGNVFVNKAQVAKDGNAAAVIFQNVSAAQSAPAGASANTVFALSMVLPAVHLAASHDATVLGYAAGASPTASFAGAQQVAGVIAPVMAGSSSRGPNSYDVNVLKPDITAPGTDIIAAYTPAGVSAAERATILAGTAVGRPGADLLTGTSMSSPHVAGAAALLRQAYPTWSTAAIKSALMTSAAQNVKLSTGATDVGVASPSLTTTNTGPFGFGAGHLTPNAALSTSLVYDITNAQYDSYNAVGLSGTQLNLPSITFGNIVGAGTATRTLKNTSASALTVTASSALPGFAVTVTPSSLTIPAGGSGTFSVRVERTTATFGAYNYGHVTWSGMGQTVRSPLTARGSSLVAYSAIEDTRAIGTRVFTVATGFSGPMVTTTSGMVPATRTSGSVAKDAQTCTNVVVPANAAALRAQLFNSETSGGAASDLDLAVYRGTTLVGASGNVDSAEMVSLTNPTAATYSVCVEGFEPLGGTASFVLNTWVVPAPVGAQTLRAAAPTTVTAGGTASVVAAWNTLAGSRTLGVVQYRQTPTGATVGATTVFVDASASAPATAEAPLLRQKMRATDR